MFSVLSFTNVESVTLSNCIMAAICLWRMGTKWQERSPALFTDAKWDALIKVRILCMSQGQEVPGQGRRVATSLQNPTENSLVLHRPFPLLTCILTMTDQSGVHSLKRTRLPQWMKLCFAYPPSAPTRNQSKSNFGFLLDRPYTDLAEEIQVRQDQWLMHYCTVGNENFPC